MNTPIRYEYADGSANLYLLTETQLQYVPVKPEESSTGRYSGGDPKKITISQSQYSELKKLFDDALDNTGIHIKDRMKTSGMITRIGSDEDQCILKPYCGEMIAIEEALKKVLDK